MGFFNRQGYGWALFIAAAVLGAQTVWAQQQNYTGDGGKGMSLTIYVPQSTGLEKNRGYIPALVQGEFVSNFSNYSAISILDWERLDDIYTKLVDEAYDDQAKAKQDVVLGQLAPTSHFLTGNITKTATGYNIKMNITKTDDKMTAATYSGTFTFAELDNLTGIRRASLDLLQKMGVKLTDKAKLELAGAVEANQVSAQTALAKGVTAQRAGTEVAALSYYYQAAALDPSLLEAAGRSSVMAANISSGNIGADARNDIAWRKSWVARLKETEETFHKIITAADPPYTLYYSTDIRQGSIDYKNETLDLSIDIALMANVSWFDAMDRSLMAVDAVLVGLQATNRKDAWGLDEWPRYGQSKTNPFGQSKHYGISVVFELVTDNGLTIGRQTVGLTPSFRMNAGYNGNNMATKYTENTTETVKFINVKADDISNNLTIRVASVNNAPPQNARFAIISTKSITELVKRKKQEREERGREKEAAPKNASEYAVFPADMKLGATIVIASLPPKAKVYIGKILLGTSNEGELRVPVGTHQLRYVKDGLEKIETVTFSPGENPVRFVNLKQ